LRLKSEALERDADLDLVAILGHASLGVKYEIRAEVGALPLEHGVVESVAAGGTGFHQGSIRLHPQRIDGEDHRLPSIVKGAEQDLDVVIGGYPVPVGEGCMHRSVRLEGTDAEMDGSRTVPHQHFGGVGCRNSVGGRKLGEPRQDRCPSPDRLIQLAIDRSVALLAG
jgi:hypothetical protein